MKRFFAEDPWCPALVEDLTRQSAIRRRKTVVGVDDGLLKPTMHHDLSGHRLRLIPDLIGKFDLSTAYEDLPPQYRKLYDSLRPSFSAVSTCQGVSAYSGRSCRSLPVPGEAEGSDAQHRDIMVALGHHLKRLWDVMSSRGRGSLTQD